MTTQPPTLIPISTPPDKWPVIGYRSDMSCVGKITDHQDAISWSVAHYHPMPMLPEPRVAWLKLHMFPGGMGIVDHNFTDKDHPPGEGWTRWEEKAV